MSRQPEGSEVEAKLLAPDEQTLRSLAALDRIGRFRVERTGTRRLHTLYLDTHDRRLLAHGIALRVRPTGSGWEMTAKQNGRVDGDLHTREEISATLDRRPTPPYFLPPGPLAENFAGLVEGLALEPLVATDIQRTTAFVRDRRGRAVAELALDRVQSATPDAETLEPPYYEVEVELLEGPISTIAEISQWLKVSLSLTPTQSNKFSRALAAIDARDAAATTGDNP